MGGYIRSDAERIEFKQINTKVNADICKAFKDVCKTKGYPINVLIETFMNQFISGTFEINFDMVKVWHNSSQEQMVINTTVNAKTHALFKECCKTKGFKLNEMFTAFMKQYIDSEYILEFKKIDK